MGPADWSILIATLQSLGLKVINVDKTTGRVVVQVPILEER